jgi:hypothetical protein
MLLRQAKSLNDDPEGVVVPHKLIGSSHKKNPHSACAKGRSTPALAKFLSASQAVDQIGAAYNLRQQNLPVKVRTHYASPRHYSHQRGHVAQT